MGLIIIDTVEFGVYIRRMAHELTGSDTMFSVLETPWHGLGTVLDSPPTVAEALRIAGLDWSVYTSPLHARLQTPEGGFYDSLVASRAVVRDDTHEVLGVVGAGYQPLQNTQALAWFDPWLASGKVTLETAGSLRGGRIVWALARIVSDPIVVKGDDTVNKYVLIAHGHDGAMAVRAGLTPIRVVCRNTLGMAVVKGDATNSLFRLSHRAGVVQRMAEVAQAIGRMDERLNEQGAAYRKMSDTEVTGGDERIVEFMGAVYRQSATDVRKGRRLDQVSELFASGTGQDLVGARGTYWGLWNAVTEYETHTAGRTAEGRAHSTAFGSGKDIIRRGFDVALSMATGTWSVEAAMGEWSDAAVLAASAHPDALTG
jgi:phage/plasmid-like protein (TIGR03299 family)